jgi:hypothetical protein
MTGFLLVITDPQTTDGGSGPTGPDNPGQPTRREREGDRRAHRRRRRRIIAAVVIALLAVPAWSLGRVLMADNTDSLGTRVVEWARDHHLNGLVNSVERIWYTHHEPKRGGTPKGGIPPAPIAAVAKTQPKVHARPSRTLARIAPFVANPLPDEGVWKAAGRTVRGGPAMFVTYLRPDPIHTSELVAVLHIDMRFARVTLHPGEQEPGGGGWSQPPRVDATNYPRLLAAFNSGFRLGASKGGYYEDGKTAGRLQDGAASFVTYRDGHVDIGIWGRDVRMTPDVVSVRQNLGLLVDGGTLAPDLASNYRWGGTLGNKVYVWRSAACVDANHDLIYVGGPGLNVPTLAAVLQRAGCQRAMELDINSEWVNAMLFSDNGKGGVAGWKLLQNMNRPADHYLVNGTRDFFEIDGR